MHHSPHSQDNRLSSVVIRLGWCALLLSLVFLLAGRSAWKAESLLLAGTCMMGARLCGLLTLAAGAVALFHQQWMHGACLLAGAVGLPIASFVMYGLL